MIQRSLGELMEKGELDVLDVVAEFMQMSLGELMEKGEFDVLDVVKDFMQR